MEVSLFDEIPEEIRGNLVKMIESIDNIEELFDKNMATSDTDESTSLERAQRDLMYTYGINSLFWMYLRCMGVDPQQHPIKQELARVLEAMKRAKQLSDKAKQPRIDAPAAKRFVRSALWQAAHKRAAKKKEFDDSDEEDEDTGKGRIE